MSQARFPKPDFATRDGRVRLYHGEALSVLSSLPSDCVDQLDTDPPYSSGGLFKGDRAGDPLDKYQQGGTNAAGPTFTGDTRDQRSWTSWMALWLGEARRLVREHGYFHLFTDWRQLPATTDAVQHAGFVWRGIGVWDKGPAARAPHRGYHRHQAEFIVWGTKGKCLKAEHDGPFPGVYSFYNSAHARDKQHPTGKPRPLMAELARTQPGSRTILDPFLGSGTTAVEALKFGRSIVGVEIDDHYFALCVDRVREQLGITRKGRRLAA